MSDKNKEIPLMIPKFFNEDDLNNPKKTTYLKKRDVVNFINGIADELAEERGSLHISQSMKAFRMLANQIRDLPDEDVAPVIYGKWIPNYYTKGHYYCSLCKRHIEDRSDNPNEHFPYCHCGAKMK